MRFRFQSKPKRSKRDLGGFMMRSNLQAKLFRAVICTLVLSAIFPVAALGQRRWARSHRSRVVIYNYEPRPYYQRRPYRSYWSYSSGYRQPYYGTRYYTYGYSQPYYTNQYYSYRYSQPYFANRYTYSWANPTYRYNESWYCHRQRRSGLRLGIRLR